MPAKRNANAPLSGDGRSSFKGLAMSAAICAAAAVYAVFLHAQDPKLATAEAENTARLALNRIGYHWAKVRIEDGVAHISGIAPGEPERVLAYETVYKALRPAMTQTLTVSRIASSLKLPEHKTIEVAGSDLPPPKADFAKSAALAKNEPALPVPPPGGT